MNPEDCQVTPFDKLRANLTYGTGFRRPLLSSLYVFSHLLTEWLA